MIVCNIMIRGGVDVFVNQLVDVAYKNVDNLYVLLDSNDALNGLYFKLKKYERISVLRKNISSRNKTSVIRDACKEAFEQYKPDIIHYVGGSVKSGLDIKEAAILKGIPLFFSEPLICEEQKFDQHTLDRIKRVYKNCNRVFAMSIGNMKYLQNLTGCDFDKIKCIYNGVDFSKIKTRNVVSKHLKKIVTVARLDYQKGIDLLINAVGALQKEQELDFTIDIYGEGSLIKEYMELVKMNKLENIIHFLGWNENIYQTLCEYDAFILPSRFEGMPIALIEALAAKLPSLTTNVKGNLEILENGKYGLVVKKESVSSLKQGILTLKNNYCYYEKLSQDAFVHAKQKHEIYQNLIKIVNCWKE